MTEVSYVPGDRTAIVGACCWALIDAMPDSAVVSEIWPRMEQESRVDALVASLLRSGLGSVPDFALLVAAEGRYRLICRGRASATLLAGESPERVDGTGLATWLECPVAAAVDRVVLGERPAGADLQLPASAGVFLASSVTIDLTAASRPPAPTPVPAPTPIPIPAPIRADVGPAEAGLDDDGSYDFLFGATQTRTVEDAAVRPVAEGHDDPLFPPPATVPQTRSAEARADLLLPLPAAPGEPPAPLPAAVPGTPPASPPPGRARGTGVADPWTAGGLIDSVPWASGTGGVPRAPGTDSVPYASGLDHRPSASAPFVPAATAAADDGFTVMRADLLKLAPRPAVPDRIGPAVHALLCPSSHVNPPDRSACRSCGAPLAQQDPVLVPRPVLGVLRLSAGDVITLDRGVVMGRSPRTDFRGEERPHVVKLPSGDGEISRTHLEVSLDGWHVLVTDLNSTNGTLMVLPGREPEQLRPGEPTPIPPGTVIILAAGVDFRYEAAG